MTLGRLWNYYSDKIIKDVNENNEAGNYRINNNKTTTSKLFEWGEWPSGLRHCN